MNNLLQKIHVVPGVRPVDLNTGANPGAYVSLKNYGQLTAIVNIGVTTGTCVMTLKQAKDIAGTGEKALAFTKVLSTGCKLKIKSATGRFTEGETVTGAGGATGIVFRDNGNELLLYTLNALAYIDAETVTGGTSGTTAKADGVKFSADILLPFTVASTYTIPAVSNRTYAIEVPASSLDSDNEYDCVRIHLAQAGAGCVGSAKYLLSEARYCGEPMEAGTDD